jgi:hypothetical protein
MSRAPLFTACGLSLLALGAPLAQPAPPVRPAASPAGAHGLTDTRCSVCHNTRTWKDVSFNHAQTGFPLRGAHQRARCSGCHSANLSQPVPTTCAACHQDPHRGEFGQRCAGCHEEQSWKTTFTADSHRSTGFPLTGRHAFIACEECHADQRDRGFSRAGATQCSSCHLADYQAAAARTVDHVALGFGQGCRDCHTPSSFKPARFSAHEQCFQIYGGPHSGIACLGCHSRLTGITAAPGSCQTLTAQCIICHSCARTDPIHAQAQVLGYQCGPNKDRKCYECHTIVAVSGARPAPPPPLRRR